MLQSLSKKYLVLLKALFKNIFSENLHKMTSPRSFDDETNYDQSNSSCNSIYIFINQFKSKFESQKFFQKIEKTSDDVNFPGLDLDVELCRLRFQSQSRNRERSRS